MAELNAGSFSNISVKIINEKLVRLVLYEYDLNTDNFFFKLEIHKINYRNCRVKRKEKKMITI